MFKTVLTKVWNWIKTAGIWIWEHMKNWKFKDWIIFILLLLAIIFGICSTYYKNKAADAEQSALAAVDTLHTYKNKLGEEYLARNVRMQQISDLKKANNELSDELKSLKDNPLVITKTKVEVRVDTLYTRSDSLMAPSEEEHRLYWHYADGGDYFTLAGNTLVRNDFSSFATQITDLRIPATITIDLVEQKNGTIKVIGKTDNPYVKLTDTDGVLIDPTQSSVIKSKFKQKRWCLGPMVGFGVTSDMKFRPYLGIGLTYGVICF